MGEGKHLLPGSDHVHPCSLDAGVQIVEVCEYICQEHNERLILKVGRNVTVLLSKKLLDLFMKFENTKKPSHFRVVQVLLEKNL